MNIVITGGLGFIGTNLILYLLKLKRDVCIRIVDNFNVGRVEDIAEVYSVDQFDEWQYRNQEWKTGVKLIKGDVLNAYLANSVCEGADAVVHLAANTGVIPSIEYPRQDCLVNVLGVFNYLDACRKNSVPRFVFASSSALLGDQTLPFSEEMCPRPVSPYGASKLCGEAYCSAFYRSYNIQTVSLRFTNVFGLFSQNKSSVVSKFIKQIISREELVVYGDGEQIRDFIYVEDICEAIWAFLTEPGVGGEIFQIGSGHSYTLSELLAMLNKLSLELLGRDFSVKFEPARVGEVFRSVSNISKVKSVLDWRLKLEFEEALRKTFEWFVKKG